MEKNVTGQEYLVELRERIGFLSVSSVRPGFLRTLDDFIRRKPSPTVSEATATYQTYIYLSDMVIIRTAISGGAS